MEPNLLATLQQALRIGLGAGQSLPDLVLDPQRAQANLNRLRNQDLGGLLQDWEQRGSETEATLQELLDRLGGRSPATPTVDTVATRVPDPRPAMDLQPLIDELTALSQDLSQLP